MIVKYQTLNPEAVVPFRATEGSVGYDLYSIENYVIEKGKRALIGTGISMEIPHGYYGRVAPRSGLAIKSWIDVAGGVIDPDYRGEIKVILVNNGESIFQVNKFDRIAQLIFEKCETPTLTISTKLTDTDRASGGFGSTN